VRELSTCGVAYHSPLLDPLLPKLTAGARAAVCQAGEFSLGFWGFQGNERRIQVLGADITGILHSQEGPAIRRFRLGLPRACAAPCSMCVKVYQCPAHALLPDRLPMPFCAALEDLIPCPKPRSERWVSAAYLPGADAPEAQLCSAGYQVQPATSETPSAASLAAEPWATKALDVSLPCSRQRRGPLEPCWKTPHACAVLAGARVPRPRAVHGCGGARPRRRGAAGGRPARRAARAAAPVPTGAALHGCHAARRGCSRDAARCGVRALAQGRGVRVAGPACARGSR
jgi:hypothetical protein